MNETQRSSLGAHLTLIQRQALEISDALHAGREPTLSEVDELHTRAAELLAMVVGMRRDAGELVFAGNYTRSPGDLVERDDKGAQRAMATDYPAQAAAQKGAA